MSTGAKRGAGGVDGDAGGGHGPGPHKRRKQATPVRHPDALHARENKPDTTEMPEIGRCKDITDSIMGMEQKRTEMIENIVDRLEMTENIVGFDKNGIEVMRNLQGIGESRIDMLDAMQVRDMTDNRLEMMGNLQRMVPDDMKRTEIIMERSGIDNVPVGKIKPSLMENIQRSENMLERSGVISRHANQRHQEIRKEPGSENQEVQRLNQAKFHCKEFLNFGKEIRSSEDDNGRHQQREHSNEESENNTIVQKEITNLREYPFDKDGERRYGLNELGDRNERLSVFNFKDSDDIDIRTFNRRDLNDGISNDKEQEKNNEYAIDRRNRLECNGKQQIPQNSNSFLEKYKAHIDEKNDPKNDVADLYVGTDFETAKQQFSITNSRNLERLSSFRIKNPDGSDKKDDALSFNAEPDQEAARFDRFTPQQLDDLRNQERFSRPQSAASDQMRRSTPEDSENYRNKSDVRHSCGRCGLMFATMEQLRIHYENEHTERNGRSSLDCKLEPYEREENSPGGNMTQNQTPNLPDPRMEAWGADFQAKMADIYKNALNFPHEMAKEALPPNFNPLCPPFPLFPTAVPPQRPMMEPIRIFNPEAYCELCSKEFCNKYFLKTHKANKHGIYENPPSSSANEGLNIEQSFIPAAFASTALKFKNNMMLADYAKSYEAALLASQRHKAKIQRMMEEARELEKSNNESQANAMHLQLNSRQIQLDDVRSSSDDNTIPENFIFKGDRAHEQDETFLTPTPRKLSPDSSKRARESGFNSEILRRLGVINPEAFCKICCKEYCNKYFLKTHKIKRHGLLPSPTGEKSSMKEQIQNLPVEEFERKDGQTSPLNLIMGEENQDRQNQECSSEATIPKQLKDVSVVQANNMRPHSSQSVSSSISVVKGDSLAEDLTKNDQAKQSPTTVFISEDLQKLQTMISQLNDLSVNKIVECYICKKEFDNNYVLQFHMMSDHGASMPGTVDTFTFPSVANEETSSESQTPQKTSCTICDKEFPSIMLLKKHIEEFHTPKLNFGDSKISLLEGLGVDKESSNQQRERRASMSLTPTNSYCEICNKELCNKYFMKTHMQRMHGIEIENGTQIGGVICDICNKELCSKYFLRVHKHNTHGIVEPGAPLPQMRNLTGEPESFNPPQPPPSPLKPPSEASILNNRFIAHFIEVCPFCSRRFRTSKWLKAHLLSDHGKAGIEKWKELEVQYKAQAKVQATKGVNMKPVGNPLSIPDAGSLASSPQNVPLDLQERLPFYSKLVEPKLMNMFSMNNPDMKTYNCSYCPFSTSILSFLYVHEKSHVQGTEMDILCPMCPESFGKPEALQFHIITAHSLPEWRERSGADESPSSNNPPATTPTETNEDCKQKLENNGKSEIFECYECDYKTCSFEDMESHLRNQHFAVRDANLDDLSNTPKTNDGFDGEDLRRKNKIPAIYAVPRNLDLEPNEQAVITMQPFLIQESNPDSEGGKFVPSLVFLPVRRRTTGAVTISFNLTPA